MGERIPELRRSGSGQPPGWLRWAGIGGGVVVAGLVLVLIAGMFSVPKVLTWGLRRVTTAAFLVVPRDVPAARRQELRRRLDCVVRLADQGRLDERRLGELARACADAAKQGSMSPDELGRIEVLAGGLCALAGGELPN
jgi:hypothetical protein